MSIGGATRASVFAADGRSPGDVAGTTDTNSYTTPSRRIAIQRTGALKPTETHFRGWLSKQGQTARLLQHAIRSTTALGDQLRL